VNKHSVALILSITLLIQPLIVVASMSTTGSVAVTLEDNGMIDAQDVGTRLDPSEHANHVPVHINGTPEFDAQGWPGDGTVGNPYVIAGLNITYDFADPLIWIVNTDAYFIIEDCYVKQISSETAIRFNNTAHAKVAYTTAFSPETSGGGFYFQYSENTVIDHVNVTSGTNIAIEMYYSAFSNITNNYLHSVVYRAFTSGYCDYAIITGNVMRNGNPGNNCLFYSSSEHSVIADSTIYGGWHSIYLVNCNDTLVEEIYIETDDRGLRIQSSFDVKVHNVEIYAVGDYGAEFSFCEAIEIDGISVSAPNDIGIQLQECNNSLLTNAFVNDTFFAGINVYKSFNSNITHSEISHTGGNPLFIQESNDCIVESVTISNSLEEGVFLASSEAALLANLDVSDIYNIGVFADASSQNGLLELSHIIAQLGGVEIEGDNWTVQDNFAQGAKGIYMDTSPNAEVYRNTIYNASMMGIHAKFCDDSKIINNTLELIDDFGIDVEWSHRTQIEGNTVTESYKGIWIGSSDNVTATKNTVLDNTYMGFGMRYSDGIVVSNNTLTNTAYLGLYIDDTLDGTFHNNVFTKSGFLFETTQTIPKLNHSLSGNIANGLPVYYGFELSSISLNGSQYGQIILVNCSDVTISGGTFNDDGSAIQIRYCTEVDITGIEMIDIRVGNVISDTNELTISDSTITGESRFRAFILQYCENVTFSNVNATSVYGLSGQTIEVSSGNHIDFIECNFYDVGSGLFFQFGGNYSVIDCTFENVEDSAINSVFASYLLVQDCAISNATYGIKNGGSHHQSMIGNDIRYCNYAIHSTGGTAAHNATVTDNHMQDNNYGISLDLADDWVIANNTILWSYFYGIAIGSMADVGEISNNTIALSGWANGFDDNTQFWDDGVDTGNYWDDFDGTAPYDIPAGGGSSQDRYPMQFIVTEPIMNSPQDLYYAEGSEGNFLAWLPFDDYLLDWEVTIDSQSWATGAWNFDNVTVNIDGLAYGTHTVFITVWDVENNYVNDTVIVHVYDDFSPEITGPANMWFFVDATDQTVEWDVSDLNPDIYILALDGEEYTTGSWTTGVLSIDVDDIGEGEHELMMTIYDADGNSATDSVLILVIDDDDNPTIDNPANIVYLEGTTGNAIVWSPSDDYPDSYQVSFNGSIVETDVWGGSRITLNVDGLAPGSYEYTITVYDVSGNFATDSVNVTVNYLIVPEEPVTDDWLLLILAGAAIGAIVIVVVIIYYMKKRTPSG